MQGVPGDDERDREYGDLVATGGAAAKPGCVVERAYQRDAGAANGREFLQQIRELTGSGVRNLDIVVLLEAGKGRLVAAGDAKDADGEDALGVDHVAEDFLDGPFSRSIAEIGLQLGQRLQHLLHFS